MSLIKDLYSLGVAIKHVDGQLRVVNKEYFTAAGLGELSGHESRRVFGAAALSGAAGTYPVIWPGSDPTTTLPTALTSMEVVSANANDDGSPAGTGAQKVKITGLTTADAEVTEEITLNGTTAVATVNQYRRINDFFVSAVGSGGVAAGNIDLRTSGGGTVWDRIPAGENNHRSSFFTIPAGKKGIITSWKAGTVDKEMVFSLETTSRYSVLYSGIFLEQDMITVKDNTAQEPREQPGFVPALTDIRVHVDNDAGGTGTAFAGYELMLEDV